MAKDDAFSTLETDVTRQRYSLLRKTAEQFFSEAIEDSFVSETRDAEGRQVVVYFYFFTSTFLVEFENPLNEVHFDFTPLRTLIYIDVSMRDFDATQATLPDSARLTVGARSEGFVAQFQASKENCHKLFRIYRSILVPAIQEGE